MKIKILQSMVGIDFELFPGDVVDTSNKDSDLTVDDANRLIEAGIAEKAAVKAKVATKAEK
ncbi:hypothetical protein ACOI22_03375 [Glaciecola sp. 2405UD65-10]|uniref:hypothetical protein n=1 Tax=Glaciecola sp. 2405UD65-10 TaxID=3397244 RepID=UPI003B5B8924